MSFDITKKTPAIVKARRLMETLEQLRLKDEDMFWPTTAVLKESNLPMSARGQNLRVLMKLAHAGYVTRHGNGQFSWRLENSYDPAMKLKLGKMVDDDDDKEDDPKPRPPQAPVFPLKPSPKSCKCGGTGKWINPKNAADIRPCFRCQGGPETWTTPVAPTSTEAGSLMVELASLRQMVEGLSESLHDLKTKQGPSEIKIKKYDGSTKSIKGPVPTVFEDVLKLASCRRNILLVGPAGCGKTYLGQLVADALDLPFSAISCTAGMSEVHLLGRSTPNLKTGKSHFQGTAFLDRCENGGVFLFDEIDAADSNLMLAINTVISNGYANVPNREDNPTAIVHKDFICMAAANTFGRGADRQYVGRNQLDAATLDRFLIGTVECDYDERVEASLCPNPVLLARLFNIREAIRANGIRRFISTRFIKDAAVMDANGWSIERIEKALFSGWSDDEKTRVLKSAN